MCDLVGSFGNDCQNITGYCSCKPNVIGRMCNKCAENTFNFESNTGCDLCQCHLIGSASQQCDSVSVQFLSSVYTIAFLCLATLSFKN